MSFNETTNQLLICLDKDFELKNHLHPDQQNFSAIKKKLREIISHMLSKDLDRLLSIFYRLDLDEKKVNTILTFSEPDKIAGGLCDLVIERELKKVETRLRYKQ